MAVIKVSLNFQKSGSGDGFTLSLQNGHDGPIIQNGNDQNHKGSEVKLPY